VYGYVISYYLSKPVRMQKGPQCFKFVSEMEQVKETNTSWGFNKARISQYAQNKLSKQKILFMIAASKAASGV